MTPFKLYSVTVKLSKMFEEVTTVIMVRVARSPLISLLIVQ